MGYRWMRMCGLLSFLCLVRLEDTQLVLFGGCMIPSDFFLFLFGSNVLMQIHNSDYNESGMIFSPIHSSYMLWQSSFKVHTFRIATGRPVRSWKQDSERGNQWLEVSER